VLKEDRQYDGRDLLNSSKCLTSGLKPYKEVGIYVCMYVSVRTCAFVWV
jgi:hypothetical protein